MAGGKPKYQIYNNKTKKHVTFNTEANLLEYMKENGLENQSYKIFNEYADNYVSLEVNESFNKRYQKKKPKKEEKITETKEDKKTETKEDKKTETEKDKKTETEEVVEEITEDLTADQAYERAYPTGKKSKKIKG